MSKPAETVAMRNTLRLHEEDHWEEPDSKGSPYSFKVYSLSIINTPL